MKTAKTATTLVIATLLGLTSGCSVLSVHERKSPRAISDGKSHKVEGVPFYAKHPVTVQETVWSELAFQIRVIVKRQDLDAKGAPDGDAKTVFDRSITVSSKTVKDMANTIQELRKLVNTTGTSPVKAITVHLDSIWNYDVHHAAPLEMRLVSNRFTTDMRIDRSRVYYLNGKHPLQGEGKIEFDLREDQTLSKVVGSVDDQTLGTILPNLAVSDLVKKAAGLAGGAGAPAGKSQWTPELAIARIERRRLTLRNETTKLAKPLQLSDAETKGYEIQWGAAAGAQSQQSASRKATFEGSLTLPK